MHSGKKIKIFYILDILRRDSDEEHPLSAPEICDKLLDYGISAERKTLYDDIAVLEQAGYDIIKTRTPKSGYFLAQREFELPELSLLADAVQAADFISERKTRDIIKKLEGFISRYEAENYRSRIFIDNRRKCENEEIYYSIDKLQKAVSDGLKVQFDYYRHKLENGQITEYVKTFTISPYALTWANDRYYLIGNNEKYDNLMHLRIDRIKNVRISREKARHFSEVSPYRNLFDTADYTGKAFNMFGGEKAKVELLCRNSVLEQVIDRFGPMIKPRIYDDDRFVILSETLISEGLKGWLMQFGADIEVLSPPALRKMVAETADKISEVYSKDKNK